MTRDRLVYGENADAFVNNREKTNKMEIRLPRFVCISVCTTIDGGGKTEKK